MNYYRYVVSVHMVTYRSKQLVGTNVEILIHMQQCCSVLTTALYTMDGVMCNVRLLVVKTHREFSPTLHLCIMF